MVLPDCGAPPHHVIRTVAALCEQRLCCDLTGHDMAREDIASRFEETTRIVETVQKVVARQDMTRQAKALHDSKVETAQTIQEPCDTVSYLGRHQKCHCSAAHVIY